MVRERHLQTTVAGFLTISLFACSCFTELQLEGAEDFTRILWLVNGLACSDKYNRTLRSLATFLLEYLPKN